MMRNQKGSELRPNHQRASAMVFALAVIAVLGLLFAVFGSRSDQLLKLSGIKSSSMILKEKANANYERVMPAVLQAYAWATEVHSGTPDAGLPVATKLMEAYASYPGELDLLKDHLRSSCPSPCVPPNLEEFHSRIFPAGEAQSEGWRFEVLGNQNVNFESDTDSWPKRFTLVVYQTDPNNPGTEMKVMGQFSVGPTSLSNFSTLAFGMRPEGIVLAEGTHSMAGFFFDLTDSQGNPIELPTEDCRTDFAGQGQPPLLKPASLYYLPPPGARLSADLIATNVGTGRHCLGLFEEHQWGSSWGGYTSHHGIIEIGGIVVMGPPQGDIAANLRQRAQVVAAAIDAYAPFNPPADGGAAAFLVPDGGASVTEPAELAPALPAMNPAKENYRPYQKSEELRFLRAKPKLEILEEKRPKESLENLHSGGNFFLRYLGLLHLWVSQATVSGLTGQSSTPITGDGVLTEAQLINAYQGAAYAWTPSSSTLVLHDCSPTGCPIDYSVTYSNTLTGQTYTRDIVTNTNVGDLPAEFNQTLVSDAPILYIVGSGSGNSIPVGKYDLTVLTKGKAVTTKSFATIPAALDLDGSDPKMGGRYAFVNYGTDDVALEIPPNFRTLDGSGTLGLIRSGSVPVPSPGTITVKLDASFISIGSGIDTGASPPPIALSSYLLSVPAGGQARTLGDFQLNGALWAPGANTQLRTLSVGLDEVLAGARSVNTSFPRKWSKSPLLDIVTSELLSITEISRSYEIIESRLVARAKEAREALNLD